MFYTYLWETGTSWGLMNKSDVTAPTGILSTRMSQVNMEGSPIITDFDGNPELEAVIADNQSPNVIYGYNLDRSVALDFPIPKPGYCGPNSPEVGDIDRDGDLEMAFTMGSGHVAVWDFPVDYSEPTTGWGAFFFVSGASEVIIKTGNEMNQILIQFLCAR
ncbi:MAG: VCBS repeat-containing protein [Candidatus Aegiribacteria sp.]|nr:VCBS repeat-containing protein [Candidatus Aegiribacteria sp.]